MLLPSAQLKEGGGVLASHLLCLLFCEPKLRVLFFPSTQASFWLSPLLVFFTAVHAFQHSNVLVSVYHRLWLRA